MMDLRIFGGFIFIFCPFYFYFLCLAFVLYNQKIHVFQFWGLFLYYFFDNFFAVLFPALSFWISLFISWATWTNPLIFLNLLSLFKNIFCFTFYKISSAVLSFHDGGFPQMTHNPSLLVHIEEEGTKSWFTAVCAWKVACKPGVYCTRTEQVKEAGNSLL